jgi:hypothetical protein
VSATSAEAAKAAALAVRQHVKDAGARERRGYLAETEKYLKKNKDGQPSAICAAIKILGYLEDVVDGKRFMDIARKATRIKPVVLLKSGGTEAGARAASSRLPIWYEQTIRSGLDAEVPRERVNGRRRLTSNRRPRLTRGPGCFPYDLGLDRQSRCGV